MNISNVPKAALGRLPVYLKFLSQFCGDRENVSAAFIARELGYGEVQVRKDLAAVSGTGRPRTGYNTQALVSQIETYLGKSSLTQAVIVGAGRLGRALLDYKGFSEYGVEIAAAFDIKNESAQTSESGKMIYPASELESFCFRSGVKIGIITVPGDAAQQVCDRLVKCNICAIWSFAPGRLTVPDSVKLGQENLALSLAHLNKQI